jgi:plastocyanin
MRTRLITSFAVAAGLTGSLLLSSCGGSSTPAETAPAGVDVEIHAVEGVAWSKTSFEVTAADGKVTIFSRNDSSIAHNLYVLDSNKKVMGQFIDLPKRGASGTRELDLAPGEYHIVCKVPGHSNMNAKLVVK